VFRRGKRTHWSFADTYSYLAHSPPVAQIAFKQNGTPRMTTTRAYDNLNRLTAISSSFSSSFAYTNYSANHLNQYTSRDVPGTNDVIGAALATNTVTVNGATAYRKGEYFWKEAGTNNTSAPAWLDITVNSAGSNVTGHAFVPQAVESFTYDYDGNLTQGGRWDYTWDGENRLTEISRVAGAPDAAKVKLACAYDARSRRMEKVVYGYDPLNYPYWLPQSTNRFLYDGWNLVAILDGTNGLAQTFTWGPDASGTMQGAGGVGGLLATTLRSGPYAGTYYYCYDGNHNVAALVDTNGLKVAEYEYGAFGELLRATGPLARLNPFLFSTKFYDWETGLYYYGYRYYDPSTGRWPSRDPINDVGHHTLGGQVRFRFLLEEEANLYRFVNNDSGNAFDPDGRKVQVCCRRVKEDRCPKSILVSCLGLQHCWLKTATKAGGMGEDPNPGTGDGTRVIIKDHSGDVGSCQDLPGADEDCVNRELEIGMSLGIWDWKNNQCQNLVADVAKKCGGKDICLKTAIVFYHPEGPVEECVLWLYDNARSN
jgi:RHS repeat-associated protein